VKFIGVNEEGEQKETEGNGGEGKETANIEY
jgi:hypothetical protein